MNVTNVFRIVIKFVLDVLLCNIYQSEAYGVNVVFAGIYTDHSNCIRSWAMCGGIISHRGTEGICTPFHIVIKNGCSNHVPISINFVKMTKDHPFPQCGVMMIINLDM